VDELGAGGMVAIKFFPGGYGKTHLDLLEIPYPIWSKAFVKLTKLKLLGKLPRMQISIPAPWEFYLPLIEDGIDLKKAEKAWGYRSPLREKGYAVSRTIGDVAGVAELSITANGIVYPSVLFAGMPSMECGNLRQQSLRDIWESSLVLSTMRSLDIQDVDGGCVNCGLSTLCGGGSRSRAYSASTSIIAADYTCPILNKDAGSNSHKPIQNPQPPQRVAATYSNSSQKERDTSEVTVLGNGPDAVRVYRRESGCEIRLRDYIIHGNEDLARILDIVLTSNGDLELFGKNIIESDKGSLDQILEVLKYIAS